MPVVVPLSILSNWEGQIKEHCVPGALSYYVYYDRARSISHKELQTYDVVITTYQIISKEHTDEESSVDVSAGLNGVKKRKRSAKGLFNIEWKVCVCAVYSCSFSVVEPGVAYYSG